MKGEGSSQTPRRTQARMEKLKCLEEEKKAAGDLAARDFRRWLIGVARVKEDGNNNTTATTTTFTVAKTAERRKMVLIVEKNRGEERLLIVI